MPLNRRAFLKNGALAVVGFGATEMLGSSFLHRAVFAAEPAKGRNRKTLVCVFQRGGIDGLNMVVPHGETGYYGLRPTIAVAAPGKGADAAVDLDGFFGLNPGLADLKPMWEEKSLAIIHAVGSPNGTRSHFDAQDFMESAAPGNKSVSTGWLARTLAACPEVAGKQKNFRAVSVTSMMPRSLAGAPEALAIPDAATFGLNSGARRQTAVPQGLADGFEAMYGARSDDAVRAAGRDALEAVKALNALRPEAYKPANGAQYPAGRLGQSLMQIAMLVKGNVGLRVAFTDCGGWDTHANEGAGTGTLATRLRELGQALAAFHIDLGDRASDVVLLTMSEFGRTARQNGTGGTDHGHGTCFLALGGPVAGGKVIGRWPGLSKDALFEGRDLAVTTDFRDVFAELAQGHLGANDLGKVLPGYRPVSLPGVLRKM